MRSPTKLSPLAALGLLLCAVAALGRPLERHMAVEIGRLEETRRLLQRFAAEVWPGWDNWGEVEFRFRFPDQTEMAVNPPSPPAGFTAVAGASRACGPVYVDLRRREPVAIRGTLTGGGGGGLQVRIRLRQSPGVLEGGAEHQILVYVHELFHGFQKRVMNMAGDDALYEYLVGAEYAALCEVEGTALERALNEADDAASRECLLDYWLARQAKRGFMPAEAAAAEESIAVSEGTATYAARRMARLILAGGYRPRLSRRLDPSFAGFRRLGESLREEMDELKDERAQTFDTIGKYYSFGAYLCFLLDRFRPGWKQGFFAGSRTLDGLVTEVVHAELPGRDAILERLEARYGWKQVLARHAAAVGERDAALARLERRRGRTYVVDLSALRESARPRTRGRTFALPGVKTLYPDGFESLTVGAIEMTGPAAPCLNVELFSLQWTADAASGEDTDPQVAWERKEGDDLCGLVYRTAGFTLKAPRARIQAEGRVTRILVLARWAP